jgi:hypothetical protein
MHGTWEACSGSTNRAFQGCPHHAHVTCTHRDFHSPAQPWKVLPGSHGTSETDASIFMLPRHGFELVTTPFSNRAPLGLEGKIAYLKRSRRRGVVWPALPPVQGCGKTISLTVPGCTTIMIMTFTNHAEARFVFSMPFIHQSLDCIVSLSLHPTHAPTHSKRET